MDQLRTCGMWIPRANMHAAKNCEAACVHANAAKESSARLFQNRILQSSPLVDVPQSSVFTAINTFASTWR